MARIPVPIAGSGGRILFAGSTNTFSDTRYANLDDYSIDPKIDLEEVTNFESAIVQNLVSTLGSFVPVHKETIIGCALSCDVSFNGFFDANNMPQNFPFNMQSGAKIFNVYIYVNKSYAPYVFSQLNGSVTGIKGNAKKGVVAFSFRGETSGAWAYPST